MLLIVKKTVILSPREKLVFDEMLKGLSNREMAANLGISKRTAETYVHTILGKFYISTKCKLIVFVRDNDVEVQVIDIRRECRKR